VKVQISEVVAIVTSLDVVARRAASESEPLLRAAAQLRAVRSWLDAVEVSIARQLAACDPLPEANLAKASRSTSRQAGEVMRREATGKKAPDLAAAMQRGEVSGAHVDAFGKALAGTTAKAAQGLLDQIHELVPIAAASNPDEFARALRQRVQRLEGDEGIARLERQRRDTRLRCWLDRHTGMWRLSGEFDPVSGALLHQRLDSAVDRLFANETPPTCPADPVAKQDHLRALALVDLTNPDRAGAGRPETIVVIDTRDLDDDGHPLVDWGIPIAAPFTAAQQYLATSRARPVIVDGSNIVDSGGPMQLGRTQRVASAAQRRALAALYPSCAIEGCSVGFRHCTIHHVDWWRHGGKTDIESLLPLCTRHHHRVHDDGWILDLRPDRTLVVTLPDGTSFSTGPPTRGVA
jgi:Domain of unknown function (DUF222)